MKKLSILMICALLSSCATLPAKKGALNTSMSWSARQQQLKTVKQWHLTGAIAIKTPGHGQSASLAWQQAKNNYKINVFGPLGAGRVTLSGMPNRVTLQANGKHYEAATPEALMQKVLGWHLPISNLIYWVRGLPATNAAAKEHFDAYHHLSALQQQGWQVQYLRYTNVDGIDLPSSIMLKQGELTVKIIISNWDL